MATAELSVDGFMQFLFLTFLFPYLMPPVGLLVTSVPAAILAARGSRRFRDGDGADAPGARPWFLFACANLALHAFFLAVFAWVSVQGSSPWFVVMLVMWVALQDVAMLRAMRSALRHRRAFVDRYAAVAAGRR